MSIPEHPMCMYRDYSLSAANELTGSLPCRGDMTMDDMVLGAECDENMCLQRASASYICKASLPRTCCSMGVCSRETYSFSV